MEFKDVIYGRRSVRHYQDRQIEEETLKEIIDAGLWAPSGVNLQPWYYVAIRSEEKMNELKEMMKKVAEKNRAHLESRFSAHPDVVKDTLYFITGLGNAPCVILAFRDKPDYSWANHDEGIVASIAISVENIVLSAYDHGIASCILTAPEQAGMCGDLRDVFAPGHGEMVCMIALGYADEEAKAPKRKDGKFVIV